MQVEYPPETEAFRDELRQWLEVNVTDEYRRLASFAEGNTRSFSLDRGKRWARMLYDAGYACIAWPTEYGGRDASAIDQIVYEEEMFRAGALNHPNVLGIGEIAPAIMTWGTDAQKAEFLPKMASAEQMWCQGFSEPGAGSDLASLRLRAVLDGEEFVLNGQKVWNSGGGNADFCELLVRTDPGADNKYKGISCLLVDMHAPGIDVRPIRLLTGHSGFYEIFFADVRVPVSALLGPMNEGWAVAHTTLAHERGVIINTHHDVRHRVQNLIELARATPMGATTAADNGMVRRCLVDLYVKGEIMAFLAEGITAMQVGGKNPGSETAIARFLFQDLNHGIPELEGAIRGPAGAMGTTGLSRAIARTTSIAGGTREIHVNNLAHRGLGLPRSY